MNEEENTGVVVPASASERITQDRLILLELDGKNEAIGRYDTILWRIRSGYVAVLYGSFLLFVGKESGLRLTVSRQTLLYAALLTVFILSIALAMMDLGFRIRQLRVVEARNKLMDVALEIACPANTTDDQLKRLLHMAGEGKMRFEMKIVSAVVLILFLYLLVPLMISTVAIMASKITTSIEPTE